MIRKAEKSGEKPELGHHWHLQRGRGKVEKAITGALAGEGLPGQPRDRAGALRFLSRRGAGRWLYLGP